MSKGGSPTFKFTCAVAEFSADNTSPLQTLKDSCFVSVEPLGSVAWT